KRLLTADLQLILQMYVAGRKKRMNAGLCRAFQRLPCARDVGAIAASQGGNPRAAHLSRYLLHGTKVAVGSNGKAGFHYVNAELLQLTRKAELLVHMHAAARRLLAIAQSGIEDGDARLVHRSPPCSQLGTLF